MKLDRILRALGPDERLGIGVLASDVFVDGRHEGGRKLVI